MRKYIYEYTVVFENGDVLTTIRFKKQNIKKQYPTAVRISVKTITNETGYNSMHKYRTDNKRAFNKDWRKAMREQRVYIMYRQKYNRD